MRRGQHLLPQVLDYWGASPARYQLAQTCVVDFAMPGTDGLRVLETLVDWPGSRILLTGQADEQIAIQAFNNGLIDQFIPKQTADIARRLMTTLTRLARTPHPRLNTLWRTALQSSHQRLAGNTIGLGGPAIEGVGTVVEYVVLGEPFGMLGLTADGQCDWLQLEPTAGLKDAADLARSAGLPYDTVQAIQAGKRLPAIEMHQQLGLQGATRTEHAFPIGGEDLLIGAQFRLSAEDLPQPIFPYRNFLDRQGVRAIQDA